AAKLRIKRRIMDEAGGIKVMGVRMERASTFSSVHRPKPERRGFSRHFTSASTASNIPTSPQRSMVTNNITTTTTTTSPTPSEKKRFSTFSIPKQLRFGAKEE
ncbi:hypothetical protein BGZ94_003175, partial [Podila epigama]